MTKAVIFDIGAVLIEFEWKQFLCRLFGEETAGIVFDATWGTAAWHELDRDALPRSEIMRMFTDNAPEYAAEITEAMTRVGECAVMHDYAIPWVQELKAQGLQVYFLSNYFPYLIWKKPEALAFIDYMDGGVFSWQEKITKPAPEIFRTLLTRYGLQAGECVFIDDSQVNVDAANALGLHAFRFVSYADTKPEIMRFLAEYTK